MITDCNFNNDKGILVTEEIVLYPAIRSTVVLIKKDYCKIEIFGGMVLLSAAERTDLRQENLARKRDKNRCGICRHIDTNCFKKYFFPADMATAKLEPDVKFDV